MRGDQMSTAETAINYKCNEKVSSFDHTTSLSQGEPEAKNNIYTC